MVRVSVSPDEADAVAVVDPDAVLTFSVSLQGFQAVAREDPQVIQSASGMELHELSLSDPGDAPEPGAGETDEQGLTFPAPKGADHPVSVLRKP